ncbi:hypothetical protein KYK29_10215 [Shinella daejeonensis]|uniref:hypothetical protein n=1 Tax=Shinella daejeonensis TaxID=659017 RepID=UPI0020C83248|nr:hypothetical protein [Shinella daejeonensis]MCP8895309.1 hypothetical protein [Shinella daejeonensis]
MPRVTHGHSFTDRRTPEYQCWLDMKQRCLNPKTEHYARYGGRGITVCDRWVHGDGVTSGFECFLLDMGSRPKGMTIDRIDNDGHYSPENCRWATRAKQVSNRDVTRRVMVDGESLSLTEACKRLGLNRKMVATRIDRGMTAEDALTHPLRKHFKKRAA